MGVLRVASLAAASRAEETPTSEALRNDMVVGKRSVEDADDEEEGCVYSREDDDGPAMNLSTLAWRRMPEYCDSQSEWRQLIIQLPLTLAPDLPLIMATTTAKKPQQAKLPQLSPQGMSIASWVVLCCSIIKHSARYSTELRTISK